MFVLRSEFCFIKLAYSLIYKYSRINNTTCASKIIKENQQRTEYFSKSFLSVGLLTNKNMENKINIRFPQMNGTSCGKFIHLSSNFAENYDLII